MEPIIDFKEIIQKEISAYLNDILKKSSESPTGDGSINISEDAALLLKDMAFRNYGFICGQNKMLVNHMDTKIRCTISKNLSKMFKEEVY